MLALRQIASNASKVLPACRWKSTLPLVDVANHDGIAVMTMQRPPVNSLNLELLQAINKSLDEVSNNKPRGLILTSASPSVFCAGLDLKEIYKPEKNRFELLANTFYDTWVKFFGFEFATAAAINVGLIDEIAVDKSDAVEKCKNSLNDSIKFRLWPTL